MIIFITTTFWESTTQPMIFVANRTLSIHPHHTVTLWFWWMMKLMVMTSTHMLGWLAYIMPMSYMLVHRGQITLLTEWNFCGCNDTSAATASWVSNKLDHLQFPPMSLDDTFGFLGPTDVMRTAQIIPSFRAGKHHSSLSSLSLCTKDSEDWWSYYQNQ